MKNIIAKYTLVVLTAFMLGACSDDDDETCERDDDICTVTVTVCCTSETECKYQVGDQEYDTFEEAVQDSECTTASKAPDNGKSSIVQGFQNLTAKAKANL